MNQDKAIRIQPFPEDYVLEVDPIEILPLFPGEGDVLAPSGLPGPSLPGPSLKKPVNSQTPVNQTEANQHDKKEKKSAR